MFNVQYRCIHREYWYDDEDSDGFPDFSAARARAVVLRTLTGRVVRVVDEYGREWARF